MRFDALLHHYERELSHLRQAGQDFARKHPKIARRLELTAGESADPHVERLIQAVAFLVARVQRRIDSDYGELPEALLTELHPHYTSPIPSLTVVQFEPDRVQGKITEGFSIKRGMQLYTDPVRGTPCIFKTCYPVTLWPLEVTEAGIRTPPASLEPPADSSHMLSIAISTQREACFSELNLDVLRFHIRTDSDQLTNNLLDLVLHKVRRLDVMVTEGKETRKLASLDPSHAIFAVGFAEEEGLLDYDSRTPLSARLLLEYFSFPSKFHFFDIKGLKPLLQGLEATRLELLLYTTESMGEHGLKVRPSQFLLGCTPAANLFKRKAEPIVLDEIRHDYRVIPDRFRDSNMEVWRVERVIGIPRSGNDQEPCELQPLFSTRHLDVDARDQGPSTQVFWTTSRRPPGDEDLQPGEVFLSTVTKGMSHCAPDVHSIVPECLCTNHDLPSRLPFGEGRTHFKLEARFGGIIRCLDKPTPTLRRALGKGGMWRLLSHLMVPLQSLMDPTHGPSLLRELLHLYDLTPHAHNVQQITGTRLVSVSRRAAIVRSAGNPAGLAHGFEIVIELDPGRFVGSSMFLFSSVLEHFFGLWVPTNAFSALVVRDRGEGRDLKRWPPRAGARCVL